MGEREAMSLIAAMAGEPQPPSTIDVARAVRDGHRRRRRLMLVRSAAVVASTCLVVGGVGVLGGGGGRSAPGPVAAAAPKRFDPLVRYADFGWLPPGMTERWAEVSSDGIVLEARTPKGKPYDWFASQVGLELLPAGKSVDEAELPEVSSGSDDRCSGDEQVGGAPAVLGRPAQWVYRSDVAGTHCRRTVTELRWQYAAGAWGAVKLAGVPGVTDVPAALVRIAETVRVGQRDPMRMPFHAQYVPPGLRLVSSLDKQSVPHAKKWGVSLEFEPPGRRPDSEESKEIDSGPSASIDVNPMSASDPNDESGPVNATVDGHPAVRKTLKDDSGTSELLRVLDVQGFEISILTSGVGRRAPERILHGLRLLGPDRAAWTARPFG